MTNYNYEDLTYVTLLNAQPLKNADRKTLKYSVDSNYNKHKLFYFEKLTDERESEESLYRKILESLLNHRVYRNPKPKKDNYKSPDYWVMGIKELWDVKGIDGNSNHLIENILSTACKRKQTPNLILHKRKTQYNINDLKKDLINVFDKNKKRYIKKVMLFDEENKLIIYLSRK